MDTRVCILTTLNMHTKYGSPNQALPHETA